MADLQKMREIARRELEKAKPRIGQPCEAHGVRGAGCDEPSTYAMGDWYPTPGSYVHCEQHIYCGHGAEVFPELPEGHPRVRSLAERGKFGV